MKDFVRACYWPFLVILICALGALALYGCASPKPAPPPFSFLHPFRDTNETVQHLQGVLTFVNIASFTVFLASLGLLFVSGLSWLTRIIAPVAGAVAAGTLVGIIALPLAPWVIWAAVLGLVGYEVYRWYKNQPPKPPQQVTMVHN